MEDSNQLKCQTPTLFLCPPRREESDSKKHSKTGEGEALPTVHVGSLASSAVELKARAFARRLHHNSSAFP